MCFQKCSNHLFSQIWRLIFDILPDFSIFPHRPRKMSESCLDTTSVGRVRTHSGCNPSISPFHSPFSPPMSPYGTQSPHYTNISQDQEVSNKPQEEDTSSSQNRIVSREMSSNSCTGSSDNQSWFVASLLLVKYRMFM